MESKAPLYSRLWTYQKERFPILGHGLMITAFTFSAVSYSRICRGQLGFISWQDFIIGAFTAFTFFFILRICDEFKDREQDALYRQYLPVPRGLISLEELNKVGVAIGAVHFLLMVLLQREMLPLYGVIMAYIFLMAKEFFAPHWLKERHLIYVISHMMIIPLIDLYSSGLDWKLDGSHIHLGVMWFMVVSFLNGLVLEIGRKIRTPETEEEGVLSYTKMYGARGAVIMWIVIITLTCIVAIGAVSYASHGLTTGIVLVVFWALSLWPSVSFLRKPSEKDAKRIEKASGIWTILMYTSLGLIPMIKNLLS